MRKKLIFLLGLIIAGILSYYSGYYLYVSSKPQTEIIEPVTFRHAGNLTKENTKNVQEYYLGKIEQDMLNIYKMPENELYESVKADGLHLQESEKKLLYTGQRFESLNEVFEFLENSMS